MVEAGQLAADAGEDFTRLGGVAARQGLLRRANVGAHAGQPWRGHRQRA
ncbi:MAG: hypothetical protein LBK76_08680 [Verrucomicrobiales bacterium]|nr:hypothetical protein [Verrucomicrobiales bacterium]